MARDSDNNVEDTTRPRPLAPCVGAVLLDLRNALRRVERCRRALSAAGYSRQRWQEIVNDVDPESRFMVGPKVLDAIISYIRSAREPVSKELLVHELSTQGAGPLRRIRQSITANLRNRKLVLYPGNKIGLPGWSKKK